MICKECAFEVDVCNCCKRDVDAGMVCTNCVVENWFCESNQVGFRCYICECMCKDSECKVRIILDGQTTCPICLEAFENRPYVLQACDLHKVCQLCGYDERLGCPVCRVGK